MQNGEDSFDNGYEPSPLEKSILESRDRYEAACNLLIEQEKLRKEQERIAKEKELFARQKQDLENKVAAAKTNPVPSNNKGSAGGVIAAIASFTLIAGLGVGLVIKYGPEIDKLIGKNTPQYTATTEPMKTIIAPTATEILQIIEEPAAIDTQRYVPVSLDVPYAIKAQYNLGLPPGQNILNNIPFQRDWKLDTPCSYNTDMPESYKIDTLIENPINVYFLIQGGWMIKQYMNQNIGSIVLSFDGVPDISLDLSAGINIRDWSINNPTAITEVTANYIQEGWVGPGYTSGDGRMDILTFSVPTDYQDKTLTGIKIIDNSKVFFDNYNPCMHINAITVERK